MERLASLLTRSASRSPSGKGRTARVHADENSPLQPSRLVADSPAGAALGEVEPAPAAAAREVGWVERDAAIRIARAVGAVAAAGALLPARRLSRRISRTCAHSPTHLSLSPQPLPDAVKVVVRVRPLPPSAPARRCVTQAGPGAVALGDGTGFQFDAVAGEEADQEAVFAAAGRPIVDAVLQGYNGCVFAYGQTGSGKTHTMLGGVAPGSAPADRGLARVTRPGVAAAAFAGAVRNRVFTTHLMGTPRDPHEDAAFIAGLSRLLFFGISPAPEPR
jgi:hypothetical protein